MKREEILISISACRKFHLRAILLVLFLMTGLLCFSQDSEFKFRYITSKDGLSSNKINDILQDAQGFMWINTSRGLNRFDAYSMKVYMRDVSDSTGYVITGATFLYKDLDNNLWAGYEKGVSRYIFESDKFEHFSIGASGASMLQDDKKRLWLGTSDGLYKYDTVTSQFFLFKHFSEVNSIQQYNKELLLFSDLNRLFLISTDNDSIYPIQEETIENQCYIDLEKHIWIRTPDNNQSLKNYLISKYDSGYRLDEHETIDKFIPYNVLYSKNEEGIWLGTRGQGLFYYSFQSKKWLEYNDSQLPNALSNNHIYSIYEDITGDIWIGTGNGVNIIHKKNQTIRHYYKYGEVNSLSHNTIMYFSEDKNGQVWIATDNGLNRFDPVSKQINPYHSVSNPSLSKRIICVHPISSKKILLGTWGSGLVIFNPETKEFIPQPGFPDNVVVSILQDKHGAIWIGTWNNGLISYDLNKQSYRQYSLPCDHIRALNADMNGNLYVGCENGLTVYNPMKNTIVYQSEGNELEKLSNNYVLTIFIENDSISWIGTRNGLNKYNINSGRITHFYKENGLPDNTIQGIFKDKKENLWITTANGISRFNLKENTFRNYFRNDGFQDNFFIDRSTLFTKSGLAFVGGDNGFNVFTPENLTINPYIPPVVITGFQLKGQPANLGDPGSPLNKNISVTRNILLNHKQSSITFEYAALNYVNSQGNQYKYKLEGFDDDWHFAGDQRKAVYANLDPGNYTFTVLGSNNDGVWNEAGTSVSIRIRPPIWKTTLAFIIYFFLFMSILIISYKLIIKWKKEHIEQRLGQMQLKFYTNIAHEILTPLTLIAEPINCILDDKIQDNNQIMNLLEIAKRNSGRLFRMTNQLMGFRKIDEKIMYLDLRKGDVVRFIRQITDSFSEHACQKNIDLSFKSNKDTYVAWFDPDKVDKIIYNLVSNAFKYSNDCGKIRIKVSIRDTSRFSSYKEALDIEVRDTGIGISKSHINNILDRFYQIDKMNSKGAGLGLALAYELVQLYKGTIDIKSEEGKGSIFMVTLPLDKDYLESQHVVCEESSGFNHSSPSLPLQPSGFNLEQSISGTQDHKPTLLVIEDNSDMQNYISQSLSANYNVVVAANGEEGYQKANQIMPDLIICDVMMPKMNGLELCRKIKNDEKLSHIMIIILSALTEKDDQIKGFEAGADNYILKPFDTKILKLKVDNLFKVRQQLKKRINDTVFDLPDDIEINALDKDFLIKCVKAIKENISIGEFNQEELSKHLLISKTHLYRKIRSLTGLSVHEFINTIKLERASQMLRSGSYTIVEITYENGFSNQSYFTRLFKERYGVTPKIYMKKTQNSKG